MTAPDPYTRVGTYRFAPQDLREFVEKCAHIATVKTDTGGAYVPRLQGEETLQWLEAREVPDPREMTAELIGRELQREDEA